MYVYGDILATGLFDGTVKLWDVTVWMYMCVYVCMYVCMYVLMYARMYVCLYV